MKIFDPYLVKELFQKVSGNIIVVNTKECDGSIRTIMPRKN